jgi:hypothetical protein
MGGLSLWHGVIVIIELGMVVLYFVSAIKILNRTGHSGWWSLISIVPIVNVIMLWKFANARWPALENSSESPG